MSQIITYGLLRDKNLEDVRNPQAGLTYLLTQLVGKRYTTEDIAFIENLSLRADLKDRLLKIADIVVNNPNTLLPARPLVTFKNRIDNYKLYTGEPNFFGGNGLVARYYNWNTVYSTTSSLSSPFDSEIFNNITPVYTESFWERGNIDYGNTNITGLNNKVGIVSHTGLFKPTVTGEYTFRIKEVTTGDVIVELTDMDGNNCIVGNNRYAPSADTDIKTKILEKFTFYKIKIFWVKSPDLAEVNDVNVLDIKIKLPYTSDFIGLRYEYLYEEGYNEKNIGKLGRFYQNKLPKGGTNFFDKKNAVIESYSFGGALSADYKAVLTRGKFTINYKPPKNYADVVETIFNIALSADSIIITNIPSTSNIQVGNLLLSESKTIPPFTYVEEIINNNTISLNTSLSQNISADTLYFIDQKGLKGYILSYTPNESLSSFDELGEFYGDDRGVVPGDVIISSNTAGYTTVSSINDGTITLNKPISSTGHTDFILFYYKSGLQNISLKGYCTGVNNLSVLNGINTTFVDSNSTIININSLTDYNGNTVGISLLTSFNPFNLFSALRVDYSNSIQDDTRVIGVDVETGDVTISKPTVDSIKAGSSILFSLSNIAYPAANPPKYMCFAPGDITAPFVSTEAGIETPSLSSIDIGYNTLEFKRLALIDSTNDSISAISSSLSASYDSKLRVTDSNNKLLDLFLVAN